MSSVLIRLKTCLFVFGVQYLHIVDVAVEPAIEGTELRANQDEGLVDFGSLQESVKIIHHPGRQ